MGHAPSSHLPASQGVSMAHRLSGQLALSIPPTQAPNKATLAQAEKRYHNPSHPLLR